MAKKQTTTSTEHLRNMQEQLANDMCPLVSYISKFLENCNSVIRPYFDHYQTLKKFPDEMQKALKALGEHGWFFDSEMSTVALCKLEQLLENGNSEDAEKALIHHFTKRMPEIQNTLYKRFSQRAKIINAAFKAHSRGEYELSVPVFLAQADGICNEMIGIKLYQKREGIPVTATYVQKVTNDISRAAILHPLCLPLPISASQGARAANFNELNRHQVLHGESVIYGTEINSLKAMSLLNYVAQVLTEDEKKEEQQAMST